MSRPTPRTSARQIKRVHDYVRDYVRDYLGPLEAGKMSIGERERPCRDLTQDMIRSRLWTYELADITH